MSDTRHEKAQGGDAGKAAPARGARKIPTGPNLTDEEIDAMYNDPDLLEYVTRVYEEEGDERRRKAELEERRAESSARMRAEVHKEALEAIDKYLDQRIKVDNFKKLERIFVAQTLYNSC